MTNSYIGISGIPGFDANPFTHISINGRKFPTVRIPVGDLGHDAASVLIENGKPVFGIEEERLNRKKHFVGKPSLSTAACLSRISKESKIHYSHYVNLSENALKIRLESLGDGDGVSVDISKEFQRTKDDTHEMINSLPNVASYDHHLCHAASAYYFSGFTRSLVFVADGCGESASISIYLGNMRELKLLKSLPVSSSLGILYTKMTHYLGFEPVEDEYKIMGLAAYGSIDRYSSFFDELTIWNSENEFHIPSLLSDDAERTLEWAKRIGAPRIGGESISHNHIDIAHSLQCWLERTVMRILRYYQNETQTNYLCMAGGVSLNCSMNGVIDRSRLFDEIFVQPAASDPGAALGAGILAYVDHESDGKLFRMPSMYIGPSYTKRDVLVALEYFSSYVNWIAPENYSALVADLIAQGNVVGWFSGAMEFGPRALGNRSILADPRRSDMKDRVNLAVKKREEFRPFAPSVLSEYANEYFELRELRQYEYMTIAVKAKESVSEKIPAVVHVNNTARVQVVFKEKNNDYWQLLNNFHAISGTPLLLNTSFNVRGEPIVCSPIDAVRCFLSTGIDYLAIEGFIVSKKVEKK